MTLEQLVESAGRLRQPGAGTARAFEAKSGELAAAIDEAMSARADLEKLVGGPRNVGIMQDNHRNHVRFMHAIFSSFSPRTFVETVAWVYRTYLSRGFAPDYWPAQFAAWRPILDDTLPEEAVREVLPFYEWLDTRHAEFVALARESA